VRAKNKRAAGGDNPNKKRGNSLSETAAIKLISKVLLGTLKISSAFVKRAFSAVAFQAATSNYSRQLREDFYQIFPPKMFEISSS